MYDTIVRQTLFAISATGARIKQAEYERASLVRTARRHGASWAQIARALGVSPQAASKRFGRRASA